MDFHHVYISAQKNLVKKWNELPYRATDDVIFDVLEAWPPEWCAPALSMTKTKNSAARWKKEETKLRMV